MEVKNDFPRADVVLRKLKEFVSFFKQKSATAKTEDDKEYFDHCLNLVREYTEAVANYLDSVCNAETRIAKVKESANSREDIMYAIETEDQTRTRNHSNIISSMIMIDRIATRNGLPKVFDVAGRFENNYAELTPTSIQEKSNMSFEARAKRREMGNFGLYIGASITAGMSREHMITDENARNFANCEGRNQETDMETYQRIRITSKSAKKNLDDVIDIG